MSNEGIKLTPEVINEIMPQICILESGQEKLKQLYENNVIKYFKKHTTWSNRRNHSQLVKR